MSVQTDYTEASVERYELLAGGRPFMTTCALCLYAAMSVTTTRKNSFRLECVACGSNGFVARADLAWALIGCGEGLHRLSFKARRALRGSLEREGAAQLTPEAWVKGVYGPEDGAVRTTFRYAVACFACGSEDASLRRDSNGKAYVTCARGCRARIFLPREEAAERLVGWTLERAERGDALWNGWFKEGRAAWQAWHAPSEGGDSSEVEAVANEVVSVENNKHARR